MFVMFCFMLPGNGFMEINGGAIPDLLPSEIYVDVQRTPGRMTQRNR
jgi:hypothetical protein